MSRRPLTIAEEVQRVEALRSTLRATPLEQAAARRHLRRAIARGRRTVRDRLTELER